MQYLLLIYGSEERWEGQSGDDQQAIYDEYIAFTNDLRAQGKLINANELQPTGAAVTVTVRGGDVITTDGPFAETKEALGGYYLIEADSVEEAAQWAARIPSARDGKIEVRPVVMRGAEVAA